MSRTLLLILAWAVSVKVQIPSSSFTATQITISEPYGNAFVPNASSNYRFQFTFQSPLAEANRIFEALAGYDLQSSNSFYIYTNVVLNGSTNGVFEFNCYEDLALYKMSFHIIATAPTKYPSMSVQSHMLYPTNLSNSALNPSAQNNQSFVLTSSLFFSHNDFAVIPYIACTTSYNYLNDVVVQVFFSNVVVNSSNFFLQLSTGNQGELYYVKLTIIIFDKNSQNTFDKVYFLSKDHHVAYGYSGPDSSLNSDSPSLPNILAPNYKRSCVFALTSFINLNNVQRKYSIFNLSNTIGSPFTDIAEGGVGIFIIRDAFCSADCSSGEFYNTNTGACDICSTHIAHCLNCSSSTHCFDCGYPAYYNSVMNKCLLNCPITMIADYGRFQCTCKAYQVIGGCTNISYCQQIDPSTFLCLKCGSNFTLSSNGTRCECLAGNPTINGYCTSITGCLSATKVNGSVICMSCNAANRFYLSTSRICNCSNGYSLKGTQCLPVCGDGKVISNEQCDDGNTINGDGCSSMCKIENYYACQNGSASHKSDCYYANPNIKLILSRTYKIPTENSGVFVFTFVPSPGILSKANFSSAVLTLTPKHQITDITFLEGELAITVAYGEDLEGASAVFGLVLDPNIVLRSIFTVSFTVKSSNYPFFVSISSSLEQKLFKIFIGILVGAVLVIFAVGSWAHRMIGVETLFPFLFVYLTLGLDDVGNDQLFSPLTQLRYIANYGEFFGSSLENHSNTVYRLSLRVNFAENNAIISIVLAGGLLALIAVGIYYKVGKNEKRRDNRTNRRKNNDKGDIDDRDHSNIHSLPSLFLLPSFFLLFRVVLLPVSLGFLPYILITAFFSSMSSTEQNCLFSTAFTLFLTILSAVIIALELVGVTQESLPRREAIHIAVFTAKSVLSTFLLALSFFYSSFLYLLAGECFCFLFTLLLLQSYSSVVQCISVIINQAVVCTWTGMIIALRLGKVSDDSKQTFLRILVGMLLGVAFIGAVRIAWQLSCYTSQKGMLEQKLICKQDIMIEHNAKREAIKKNKDVVAHYQNLFNLAFHKVQIYDPALNIMGESIPIAGIRPLSDGPIKQMKVRLKQNLLGERQY